MKYIVIATVAFFAAGCEKTPISVNKTDNPAVTTSLLFTQDGCRVYRFYDAGRVHYFADCRGSVSNDYQVACGKGCVTTVPDSIQTVTE